MKELIQGTYLSRVETQSSKMTRSPEIRLAEAIGAADLVILKSNEPAKDFGRLKKVLIGAAEEQNPPRKLLRFTPARGIEDWETGKPIACCSQLNEALRICSGSEISGGFVLVIPEAQHHFPEYGNETFQNMFEVSSCLDYFAARPKKPIEKSQKACLLFVLPPDKDVPDEVQNLGIGIKLPPPKPKEVELLLETLERDLSRARFVSEDYSQMIRELQGVSEHDTFKLLAQVIKGQREVSLRTVLPKIRERKREIAEGTGFLIYKPPETTFRPVGYDYFLLWWERLVENDVFAPGSEDWPHLVLIVGPPGTGKTEVASRAIVEAGWDSYEIDALELHGRGGIYGGAGKALKTLFDTLHSLKGMGVWNELARDMAHDPTGRTDAGTSSRVGGGILKLIEAGRDSTIIGTINDPEGIPPALLRPGRLSTAFYAGHLGEEQIRDVALLHLEKAAQKEKLVFTSQMSKMEAAQAIATNTCRRNEPPSFAAEVIKNMRRMGREVTLDLINEGIQVTPKGIHTYIASAREEDAYRWFADHLPSVFDGLTTLERGQKVQKEVDLMPKRTIFQMSGS